MNMINKIPLCLAIALFIPMLAGCASTFNAKHDHDPDHDFTDYQTFAWITEKPMKMVRDAQDSRITNPLLEPGIMTEVESALGTKGYTKIDDPATANFVLSFTVGTREEIRVDSYPRMARGTGTYPSHWGWGSAYYFGTETFVSRYEEGMLAIDVFDGKERKPVWHGVATKAIDNSDRDNLAATIKAAVEAVLVGFPPD